MNHIYRINHDIAESVRCHRNALLGHRTQPRVSTLKHSAWCDGSMYFFRHSWESTARGYWWRYPNPHSSHVFSVDTLEVKQEGDLLYTRRLVLKTNSLPSWGKHFFSDAKVAVIEECMVDRSKPSLTWYTRCPLLLFLKLDCASCFCIFFHFRNIGLTPFMATVERVTITPNESSSLLTKIFKECWIDSSIFGFRSAIKKFGVDRYKKNCGPATEGFNIVLHSHADGSKPFNGSGLEMKTVQHPSLKTGVEVTLTQNVECVVSPNNVVPVKVALETC